MTDLALGAETPLGEVQGVLLNRRPTLYWVVRNGVGQWASWEDLEQAVGKEER